MKITGWIAPVILAMLMHLPAPSLAADGGTISGTIQVKKSRDLPNVVVYLTGVKGDFPAPTEHVIMDQASLTFKPHVLPVLRGTTVDFRNSDSILHNVFSPDEIADKFNLGTWPKGEIRSHEFKKSGVAVMLCNVHPEMEAWVYVLDNPYFTKASKDGSFEITGVPPGKYTLKTWHKKLKPVETEVEVSAGETATVELKMLKRGR